VCLLTKRIGTRCGTILRSRIFLMSEAELLRARAKCFLAWAVQTRERGDYKLAEYLVALSRECLDDAEALDVTRGQNPRSRIKTNLGRMRRSRRC